MISKLACFFSIFTKKQTTFLFVTILLSIFCAVFESIGLAALIPLTQVVSDPNIIKTNEILNFLFKFLKFTDQTKFTYFLCWAGLCIIIFSILFRAISTYLATKFVMLYEYSLSIRLFEAFCEQPYSWFISQNSSRLYKILFSEVTNVIQGILIPLLQCLSNIFVVLLISFMCFITSPLITITIIAFFLITYFASYFLSFCRLTILGNHRIIANTNRQRFTRETFDSFKDLKAVGKEKIFFEKFKANTLAYCKNYICSQKYVLFPKVALEMCLYAGGVVALIFFLKDTDNLNCKIPLLTFFGFAGVRLLPAVQGVFSNLNGIKFMYPSLIEVSSFLSSLKKTKTKILREAPHLTLNYGLEFKNVSYSYPSSKKPVCKDLNFRVSVGKITAFAGKSGSGKTTILDLMLGLLQPSEGKILIDGVELTKINLSSWQDLLSYVSQNTVLVDDTIKSNIALGESVDKIDQKKLNDAVRKSQLRRFVHQESLSNYDTQIGEKGVCLSGGQRQRLAIARALYRRSKLIIFDESTSALDNKTEELLMRSIEKHKKRKAIVMVAHRASTLKYADSIYIVKKGKIVSLKKNNV